MISDPPGVKVGSGGSTLHCLEYLANNFGQHSLSQCEFNLDSMAYNTHQTQYKIKKFQAQSTVPIKCKVKNVSTLHARNVG